MLEYLIEVLIIFIMRLSYADQINYLFHYSLLYILYVTLTPMKELDKYYQLYMQ